MERVLNTFSNLFEGSRQALSCRIGCTLFLDQIHLNHVDFLINVHHGVGRCRKEALWPHTREFADRGIAHVKSTLAALSAAGEACELYAIHGHYADAGDVASLMAATLGTDMVFTGHSLGRNKLDHMLRTGAFRNSVLHGLHPVDLLQAHTFKVLTCFARSWRCLP